MLREVAVAVLLETAATSPAEEVAATTTLEKNMMDRAGLMPCSLDCVGKLRRVIYMLISRCIPEDFPQWTKL